MSTKMVAAGMALSMSICSFSRAQQASWQFQFRAETHRTNVVRLDTFVFPPGGPFPADGTDVTFSTPDGSSAGYASPVSGSATGEYFGSFDALRGSVGGDWSMTAVRGGVTSEYTFSADLSGISEDSIPKILSVDLPPIGVPYTDRQPTFHWANSGVFTEGFLDVYDPDFGIHYHADLPVSQTYWTVPVALPAGSYVFSLQLPTTNYTVPFTSTLLSGPDLGLPDTASFGAEAWYEGSFSVVPEPATTTLACAGGVYFLARRRRRSVSDPVE